MHQSTGCYVYRIQSDVLLETSPSFLNVRDIVQASPARPSGEHQVELISPSISDGVHHHHKCPRADCPYYGIGFALRKDLNRHEATVHTEVFELPSMYIKSRDWHDY